MILYEFRVILSMKKLLMLRVEDLEYLVRGVIAQLTGHRSAQMIMQDYGKLI